jgi:hypothetical protein
MTRQDISFRVLCWMLSTGLAGALPAFALPERVSFARDVRPILIAKCFACHGPDETARKAGLRLDQPVAGRAARNGRPLVVAGRPEDGELLRRLVATEPEVVMPPPEARHPLSDQERSLLRRWAMEGAPYEQHWAFVPPKAQRVPPVKDRAWPLNPVDFFILHRLEAAGVKPSPDADRRTLLRRASFDLTGLPPSPEEVAAFERDREPRAFERQLERLLDSPQFGERMALLWLDLVRYADTDGYHADNPREVRPYRDYVISAFHENLSFDVFTAAQLAGDLAPGAGRFDYIASAYNMLVKTTEENGANEREYLLRYAADRVRNVSSVWLGLTLGCAECHDHKTDPLTTRDFYRFSAFFADLKEKGVGKREPAFLPTPEQQAQLTELNQEIEAFNSQLARAKSDLLPQVEPWMRHLQSLHRQRVLRWNPVRDLTARGGPGQVFEPRPDGSLRVTGEEVVADYEIEFGTDLKQAGALRLELIRDPELFLQLERRGWQTNTCLAEVELEARFPDGRLQPVKFYQAHVELQLGTNGADHLIDGRRDTVWEVGRRVAAPLKAATFVLDQPLTIPAGSRLRVHLRHLPTHPHSQVRQFRLSLSPIGLQLPEDTVLPKHALAVLERAPDTWTKADRDEFAIFYNEWAPELRVFKMRAPALERRKDELGAAIERCVVSQPGPPRITRVLPRGNWMDESGELVEPAIPAVFGGGAKPDRRLTRADLAKWLVSPDNPLTARVFVNRLWKHFFGTGLVRTLNDFGVTGDPPSHPELLDGLAIDFMASGWNVKHVVSLLIGSRTYRQSSLGRPDLERRDPENRLFARQGRWRLEAELIRDRALFIAGCLVTNVGGMACYPYQPAGHLDQLDFPQRGYDPSPGLAQYRRGLYVFRQRSFPHPALTIFDAPSREECVAERPTSNNPLQALALLNDPSHVEAAGILAVLATNRRPGGKPGDILDVMAARSLNRSLTAAEREELLGLYRRQLERTRQSEDRGRGLLSAIRLRAESPVPLEELAAWTTVARALLNLHETITRY